MITEFRTSLLTAIIVGRSWSRSLAAITFRTPCKVVVTTVPVTQHVMPAVKNAPKNTSKLQPIGS